ncbi:MAG: hypothetical protein JXA81_15655 [Sedimentisphaerales bacterium]|nr:hypothetical protein [Sedimentisphaerales bacterium]
MKENENKLEKAVEALKNEQIPPGPPHELTNSTIAKLTEAVGQSDTIEFQNRIRNIEGLRSAKSLIKIAAVAVLLIAAGYATGRLAAPQPPDMEQIRAALEPEIRQNLFAETKQYLQLGMANGYIRIQDELRQQYRQDLNRFAVQTLAASNAVTNELLTELIESINATQSQDLRRIAAALEQMELNRLYDKTQLVSGLETLAYQTEGELQRTKQDMAQLLYYAQPGFSIPDEIRNSENSNERTEK